VISSHSVFSVEEFLQEVGQFQLDNTSLSVPLTDLVGDLLLRQSHAAL
jgi:hypothetical protein